jgi:hypothetical protein
MVIEWMVKMDVGQGEKESRYSAAVTQDRRSASQISHKFPPMLAQRRTYKEIGTSNIIFELGFFHLTTLFAPLPLNISATTSPLLFVPIR